MNKVDLIMALADNYQRLKIGEGTYNARAALLAAVQAQAAEVEALRADAEMLDWLGEKGLVHVFSVGNTWYSRIAYGQPYTKHKTLREAVNAARAAQEE